MRTDFLVRESKVLDIACWKDDALYVVEVDASSIQTYIQIPYRERMQQHGTFVYYDNNIYITIK